MSAFWERNGTVLLMGAITYFMALLAGLDHQQSVLVAWFAYLIAMGKA